MVVQINFPNFNYMLFVYNGVEVYNVCCIQEKEDDCS